MNGSFIVEQAGPRLFFVGPGDNPRAYSVESIDAALALVCHLMELELLLAGAKPDSGSDADVPAAPEFARHVNGGRK